MDEYQITDEATNLLDLHLKSTLGAISQEPYKGDLFRVFENAYNAGLDLKTDRLIDIMIERWPEYDYTDEARQQMLERFSCYWRDWSYAWDRAYRKAHQ